MRTPQSWARNPMFISFLGDHLQSRCSVWVAWEPLSPRVTLCTALVSLFVRFWGGVGAPILRITVEPPLALTLPVRFLGKSRFNKLQGPPHCFPKAVAPKLRAHEFFTGYICVCAPYFILLFSFIYLFLGRTPPCSGAVQLRAGLCLEHLAQAV